MRFLAFVTPVHQLQPLTSAPGGRLGVPASVMAIDVRFPDVPDSGDRGHDGRGDGDPRTAAKMIEWPIAAHVAHGLVPAVENIARWRDPEGRAGGVVLDGDLEPADGAGVPDPRCTEWVLRGAVRLFRAGCRSGGSAGRAWRGCDWGDAETVLERARAPDVFPVMLPRRWVRAVLPGCRSCCWTEGWLPG